MIVACTTFGIGPASAITGQATKILQTPTIDFFFTAQLPLVVPMSLLMAVSFFFVNRYFDRRDGLLGAPAQAVTPTDAVEAPRLYAIFPVLPLVFLLLFSELVGVFAVELSTTTAMFVSLALAAAVHTLRKQDLVASMASLKVVWTGMANIFKSVVTLVVAAAIFSKGLIALGFIRALLSLTETVGLGSIGVGVMMTVLIFAASTLMGSGNASFFAFGPLVPRISAGLGVDPSLLILPMQPFGEHGPHNVSDRGGGHCDGTTCRCRAHRYCSAQRDSRRRLSGVHAGLSLLNRVIEVRHGVERITVWPVVRDGVDGRDLVGPELS